MAKTLSARTKKSAIRLVSDSGEGPAPATTGRTPKTKTPRKPLGPQGFDTEAEALPEAITDAAFRSGEYPYGKRMKRKRYERELEPLQIELQKLATWVRERKVLTLDHRHFGIYRDPKGRALEMLPA